MCVKSWQIKWGFRKVFFIRNIFYNMIIIQFNNSIKIIKIILGVCKKTKTNLLFK